MNDAFQGPSGDSGVTKGAYAKQNLIAKTKKKKKRESELVQQSDSHQQTKLRLADDLFASRRRRQVSASYPYVRSRRHARISGGGGSFSFRECQTNAQRNSVGSKQKLDPSQSLIASSHGLACLGEASYENNERDEAPAKPHLAPASGGRSDRAAF